MTKEAIDEFINYLDKLEEMITLFKGLKLSSEIMNDITISEEQAEVSNVYLSKVQEEWEGGFVTLLEIGVNWLKPQGESKGDVE